MVVRADILCGVCGFRCTVEAASEDGMNVTLKVEGNCPRVQAMAADLLTLDAFRELLRMPAVQTTPMLLAAKHKLHPTCLVPTGILKAMEAAAGLALPAESTIGLERVE